MRIFKTKKYLNHLYFSKKVFTMSTKDKYLESRILLKEILRYHNRRPMLYRSNVYLHEQRVLALVEGAFPFVRDRTKEIELPLLRAFAKVHDDIELIGREFTSPDQEPDQSESRDIRRRFKALNGGYDFSVEGFEVKDLQILYRLQNSIEAQLVRYADRFDGLGECAHEVAAGNRTFEEALGTHVSKLQALRRELPLLAPLLNQRHPFFDIRDFDAEKLKYGEHTAASLEEKSGYGPYSFWRKALLMKGDDDVHLSLTLIKERPKIPVTASL